MNAQLIYYINSNPFRSSWPSTVSVGVIWVEQAKNKESVKPWRKGGMCSRTSIERIDGSHASVESSAEAIIVVIEAAVLQFCVIFRRKCNARPAKL
jgi:hypothetical protein